MQPKFIITSTGHLRLGMVYMHKDLLRGDEECLGGGYYEFDYVGMRLLLWGNSYDFGPPRWDWLDELRVPAAYEGLRIVYSRTGEKEGMLDISSLVRIIYEQAG